MYNQNEKIIPRDIEEEVKDSYLNYAMSVIVGRALPDAKDGLKPVHRRILYAMYEDGLLHNRPFRKSATVVGNVIGRYHPHGDSAVYDALVRLAQDWNMRYLLIDSQGNFGSVDGDPAAAYRYCITGDTLVLTDKGLIPIGEISESQESKINLKVLNYAGKVKRADRFFNSGKHRIIKISTKSGYKLSGSYNHPVLCWSRNKEGGLVTKWKMLKDLRKDGYVIINRNHNLFNRKELSLKRYFPKFNSRYRNISLPKWMNEDLAFLLGALVSEGSFNNSARNHTICFNNKNKNFYKKIFSIIKGQFKGVSLYERDIEGDCKDLSIYHQIVVIFLENLGLKNSKSDSKEIPSVIFHSKRNYIQKFLMGLYEGDGSVVFSIDKRHKGRSMWIHYDSQSRKLIEQLKILLLSFGIVTNKIAPDKRNNCYRLTITGYQNIKLFQENIGFYSKRKKEILSQISTINSKRMSKIDYIPYLADYLRRNYKKNVFIKKYNFDRYNKLKDNYIKLRGILKEKDIKLIGWLIKNNFFFDKIEAIERRKEKNYVYSLRVNSSCHSFIANGFINHNTEARLSTIAEELLADIDKETVRFIPNFDNSRVEPWVLPGRFPNLLVNGSSGIAVGMATNMPPHNLGEVLGAIEYLIDNPAAEIKDLMRYIRGPDFPTGGLICGRAGVKEAYETGKGKLTIRATASIEHQKQGKDSIVITEIPYQVNKANLIESIASLAEARKIEGITDIRDESDKEGIRIIVELRRDVEPQIILNQLFKHTQLEETFGIINLALVDGRPHILNLKQLLSLFIDHRKEIIRRRTQFDLDKAEKRAHILEGLKIALKHIDQIIKTIKTSKNTDEARHRLIKEFGLTEVQAQAILEMQLQRLTALERDKIEAEYLELIKKIQIYKSILASEKKVEEIIKEECQELKKKYADERRTQIVAEAEEIELEDLIVEEDMVITISHLGYIKRLPVSSYRKQRRGGRGVTAMETGEEDFVKHLFVASSKDYLLIFTNRGKAYWLKVYEIPEASRAAKGKAVVNLLALSSGERISSVVAVKEFAEDKYLLMCTNQGLVKKTKLSCFSNPRRAGIVAVGLDKNDYLVEAGLTDGKQRVLLATRKGKSVLFHEKQIRDMGRSARGVRGIKLGEKDEIVGTEVLPQEAEKMGLTLLTVTTGGFAKRTEFSEYRLQSRGGKGIINIKTTSRNGEVAGVASVNDEDEIMAVTQKGMIVRCPVKDIRQTGRNTQGVRLISLEKGDTVASIAKVVAKEE